MYRTYYNTNVEVRKVKKEKNNIENKKIIKTKNRLDGGIEVEIQKDPSKTTIGKIFAIIIAFITIFGSVGALIYLLLQM